MKLRTVAGELLPVFGTMGLLGLWLYQQTQIDVKNGLLQKINAAHGVYQTYQSNNAIFNSIIRTVEDKTEVVAYIRTMQTSNYETGLSAMEAVLSSSERVGIPARPNSFIVNDELINITQRRLDLIQERVEAKKNALDEETQTLKQRYFWAYICFSGLSVLGATFKILDKIKPVNPA